MAALAEARSKREADLAGLPGLGDNKIKYLREVFNTPFMGGRGEEEG
jgi:hypothetical protein